MFELSLVKRDEREKSDHNKRPATRVQMLTILTTLCIWLNVIKYYNQVITITGLTISYVYDGQNNRKNHVCNEQNHGEISASNTNLVHEKIS